jgi:hypothetical protein
MTRQSRFLRFLITLAEMVGVTAVLCSFIYLLAAPDCWLKVWVICFLFGVTAALDSREKRH